jgi:flagellar assembly protein FliH
MSSSARRLNAVQVTPFIWNGQTPIEGPPQVQHARHADHAPAAIVVEPAITAAGLDESRAAHQAHLAALEREAFASGHAAGERAGLEAGNKRAEAMLRRLAQTLDELRSLRATMIRQTEQQMVQLALAIAKRILRREATVDQDLLVALARVALERLGDAGNATIRLHPEDCSHTVQRHGDHWAGARVRVIADPSVSRGGCLVESDFGLIDAGVEAQFEQVARSFAGEGPIEKSIDKKQAA